VVAVESLNPRIVTDGEGGAIVVWETFIVQRDLRAQRIDKNGFFLWGEDGIPICLDPYGQGIGSSGEDNMLADGKGGAFLAWLDYRHYPPTTPMPEIYVQHIDMNGHVSWQEDGLPAFVGLRPYRCCPIVVAGDNDGVYVVCSGTDGAISETIRVQKIDKFGSRVWGDSGLVIVDSYNLNAPIAVSDSCGGLYVIWADLSDESGQFEDYLYAQRISSDGKLLWPSPGILVHRSKWGHYPYQGAVDGKNGCYLVYRYNSEPVKQLIANRITPNGELLWGPEGISISYGTPEIGFFNTGPIADNNGGFIVGWCEYVTPDTLNYFVQRLDSLGNSLWTETKTSGGEHLTPDGLGGILFVVSEDSLAWNASVHIKRVDSSGEMLWGNSGTLISSKRRIEMLEMIPDGNGGAIVVFVNDFTIFVQKIEANGQLGGITGVKHFPPQTRSPTHFFCQNHPNPFNPETRISFALPKEMRITLRLYNLFGEEVARLYDGSMSVGAHSLIWNGRSQFGQAVSSGLYIYRLESEQALLTGKMILMR